MHEDYRKLVFFSASVGNTSYFRCVHKTDMTLVMNMKVYECFTLLMQKLALFKMSFVMTN